MNHEVELDETYVVHNHKGLKKKDTLGKKRGTPAKKRGLSDEQVCILTGVQRLGGFFSHAFNMGKPKTEDIKHLENHLEKGSYVYIDGLRSYHQLLKTKECQWVEMKDYNTYDKVNHLNNVNSFHDKIKRQYEKYRGVASKYINRYCALFILQREYADMDNQEFLQLLLGRLRKITDYFFIRQISSEDLFDPVMS